MDILDDQLKEINLSLIIKTIQTKLPDLEDNQVQLIESILSEEFSFPKKFKKGEILSAHSLNKMIQFFLNYSSELEKRINRLETIIIESSNNSKNKTKKHFVKIN